MIEIPVGSVLLTIGAVTIIVAIGLSYVNSTKPRRNARRDYKRKSFKEYKKEEVK